MRSRGHVRLEAVMLADKTRVAVLPPAILRCTFAEAVVHWVREDLAPAMRSSGTTLKAIDNFASYECRGRNRVAGAKVSEHGKGNALDVRCDQARRRQDARIDRSLCLRRSCARTLRRRTCERFTTVLRPGLRRLHENHVHLDLVERRRGHRICQWDVREPARAFRARSRARFRAEPEPGLEPSPQLTSSITRVPLPRPRPVRSGQVVSRAMPLSNLAVRDIETLVHPYTNLAAIRESGPLVLERGQGVFVYDTEGKAYIEGMAGLWCTALGYSNEELVEAAAAQMRKLPFAHLFTGKSHDPAIELAERLKEIAPVPTSKVLFSSSGSEANDAQIKLVWYMNNALGRPRKKKIISRIKAYHGVTVAAASLTGLRQQPPGLRPADRRHPAHRLPASLPLRERRRERA